MCSLFDGIEADKTNAKNCFPEGAGLNQGTHGPDMRRERNKMVSHKYIFIVEVHKTCRCISNSSRDVPSQQNNDQPLLPTTLKVDN